MVIKSKNRGGFELTPDMINEFPQLVHEIFMNVIPIETKHDFLTESIHYWCIGDVFDEVPVGCAIPEYNVIIDTKQMTVRFEKK